MTETLRTLWSLRTMRLHEAQQTWLASQAECAKLRAFVAECRAGRRWAEAQLKAKCDEFAATSSLSDLIWCERELEALRHSVAQTRARLIESERALDHAERRLHEAEAKVREDQVASRAVSQVIERGEREAEKRAALREEDEVAEGYRVRAPV